MQWVKDKDENEFQIDGETWAHILEFHPEITEAKDIESVLLDPDAIVKSNWDSASILYYKQVRPRRFRVVVVQTIEKRVKTTLTTDKIKKGEILWAKEKPIF